MKTRLRRGDLVEVRSADEILSTLDESGALDALPFMHEMLQYCGRRFVVDKRASKVCDTIKTYGSRRIPDTVLLEDLRCDGSGHDGCQAECRIFWKESWLRKVGPGDPRSTTRAGDGGYAALAELVSRCSKKKHESEGSPEERFRCQATELYTASTRLRVWDPRVYIQEFTSGNVPFGRFARVTARAVVEEPLRKYGYFPTVPLPGNRTGPASAEKLDLQPGEWVQVKSREEIAATLTPEGRERGLWFDREMLPFCNGTYRVRQRVNRFIDDKTGRMIELKTECVTLEGVVCSGDLSMHRHLCPRAIYPYWRESWLRRAGVAEQAPSPLKERVGV